MRVLELCLSDGHGGLELHVARLCECLRARGRDCRALTRPGTRLNARIRELGVPMYELETRVAALPLLAARRLAQLVDREGIDVIHLHWSRDLPLAAFAKRLARRPVRLIHSRHMAITRPKCDAYHRFLYRSLDRYLVLSQVMYEEALRYLPIPADRIEIVHLGVAAPTSPTTTEPESRARHRFEIGLFGRIEPFKGQHLLIEAIDLLRKHGVDAHATIIGHAMDEAYLARLKEDVARRGLEQAVSFSGFHPSPPALMPGFDVIVLTTRRETFGLVLVEAMLCGVAVIGTNAGGVPEIIEHEQSGLLFEPESAVSLASQLERLASDPALRQRLARAGRERAETMFSEARHVAHIEALLGLDNPGGGR